MRAYLDLARNILEEGHPVPSVQGVGCFRKEASQLFFDNIDTSFPLLTNRNLRGSWKAMRVELLWYLQGSTSLNDLHRYGVYVWDKWDMPPTRTRPEWQRPANDVGPVYGHQLRNFGATRNPDGSYANDGVDQIAQLVEQLKDRPYDRRMRITTWNPTDLPHQFICCCHGDVHFYVENGKLNCHHKQRSCDFWVGGPFNIADYALMLMMLAQVAGLKPGHMTWSIDDCHTYLNQPARLLDLLYPTGKLNEWGDEITEIDDRVLRWAEQTPRHIEDLFSFDSKLPTQQQQGNRLQDWLNRAPRPLPTVELNPSITDVFSFRLQDFVLKGYNPHAAIKDIPVLP